MTIRRKLIQGFTITALLVAVLAAVSVRNLNGIAAAIDDASATTLPEIRETNRAAHAAAILLTLTDDSIPQTQQSRQLRARQSFKQIAMAIKAMREEAGLRISQIDSPVAREVESAFLRDVQKLELLSSECERTVTAHLAAVSGSAPANVATSAAALQSSVQKLLTASLQLQDYAREEIESVLSVTGMISTASRNLVAVTGGIAIVFALAVGAMIARPIATRIEHVRNVAEQIGKGDLHVRLDAESNDEIGQLSRTVNHMTEQLARTRDELVRAAEAAKSANHAKSAFLANMSHEIRTPMTAIVGFAETLLDPHRSPSYRLDALQIILRNARHLIELINDVLDLSKIEADKMTIERTDSELMVLLAEVMSMMRARAVEKGLDLKLVFSSPVPKRINTDPLRLRQILVNLLGNAIKFTQAGQIRLIVFSDNVNGRMILRFSIADTGVGMTPDQIGRLFQPFTQADQSTTRRFGGTGLGLTISRRLAGLLGGDIHAHSEPGVGSTFTLTTDAGPAGNQEMLSEVTEAMLPTMIGGAVPLREIRLKGCALLVEDGRDNQELITLHLRDAGADVTVAENGRTGVHAAQAGNFDVILMDMQMPEMDGYSATSLLRSRGYKGPIIALTAHAMSDDREKCMRAGCTEYLTKPVDRAELVEMISKYMPHDVVQQRHDWFAGNPTANSESVLRSTVARDPKMAKVVQDFVSRLPVRVAELNKTIDEQNLDSLRQVAHRLKGAGGGYGFMPITVLAAGLEKRIKDSDPLGLIKKEVDALVQMIRSVEGYDPGKEVIAPAEAVADSRK